MKMFFKVVGIAAGVSVASSLLTNAFVKNADKVKKTLCVDEEKKNKN